MVWLFLGDGGRVCVWGGDGSLTCWSKDSKLGLVKQWVFLWLTYWVRNCLQFSLLGEELLTGARTTQRQLHNQKIHSSVVNTDTHFDCSRRPQAAMETSDQKPNTICTPSSSGYLHSHETFSKWGGDWDEGLVENPSQFGGLPSDWFLPFTYFSYIQLASQGRPKPTKSP